MTLKGLQEVAEQIRQAHGLYDDALELGEERTLRVGLEVDAVSVLPATQNTTPGQGSEGPLEA